MLATLAVSALCAVLSLPASVNAAAVPAPHHELAARAAKPYWLLTKNIFGHKFYDHFHFFDQPDPTDGLVEYLSLDRARKWNLTEVIDDKVFVMRGDATQKLKLGQKRKSTRIESKVAYDNHVHILDVGHMPTGRGSWPAYWMVGPDWPRGGEMDIIEGANDIAPNLMTLHTTPGCTMEGMVNRTQTGLIRAQDCNAFANGNVGCGVRGTKGNDFGPALNTGNGGYFAYQKTDDEIKVWFWKRYSNSIPGDIRNSGAKVIDPSTWGAPDGHWKSSTTCNLREKIKPMKIIMNLTFCGGFGGHTYGAGGTPACEEFVRSNPQAFKDAFWKVYGLRIYEQK